MAIDERPTARPAAAAPAGGDEPRGFRPASRRRARIASGAALAAVAIGGNVLVYSSLDDTTEVLQVVDNIRAGEVVTSNDLRIVEVDLDPTVPVVRADEIGLVINRYARTYIASGTLIAPQLVQSTPLVSPGSSVVAIEVRPTDIPANLRERSRVRLVVRSDDGDDFSAEGRVVARGDSSDSVTGVFALSVEVPDDSAATLVAADEIGVILLDPAADGAIDPATEQATGRPTGEDGG